MYALFRKLNYWLWALLKSVDQDRSCPFCGSLECRFIHRKALVTSLHECNRCGLRFRLPKSLPDEAARFYQSRYRSGFTTDCPSSEALGDLLATNFEGSPKDFASRVEFLKAAGLKPGDSILDYGCSWGYGSWQLARAGFDVYSYEVSRPRAEYAREELGCRMVGDLSEIRESIRCLFSAHVIEHLPDPNIMWQFADQALCPDGLVVCFAPNGDPYREEAVGYHRLWGNVHPLLITKAALKEMAKQYGFRPCVFSSPYSSSKVRNLEEDDVLDGSELALVAWRSSGAMETGL